MSHQRLPGVDLDRVCGNVFRLRQQLLSSEHSAATESNPWQLMAPEQKRQTALKAVEETILEQLGALCQVVHNLLLCIR
jgi:hypothetical protein